MPSYGLVESLEDLRTLTQKMLTDAVPFGFDIETGYDGPERDSASLLPEYPHTFIAGISFSNDPAWARYVPMRHDLSANIDPGEVARTLWPLLNTGLGVAHNAKFELRHLRRLLLEHVPESRATDGYFPVLSDTMLEAYVVAEWQLKGLKPLVKEIFGHKMMDIEELFPELTKKKLKSLRFNTLALSPKVVEYACEDSAWCLALHKANHSAVKDNFIYTVEMENLPGVCEMEDVGVLYDWEAMASYAVEAEVFLGKMYEEVMADLSAMAGEPVRINIGSAQQVSKVLFDMLGMRTTRYTKSSRDTGDKKMSTDAVALAGLAKQFPVVKKILEWKEMRVLLTRYLQKYQTDYGYALDGRTHPNHQQAGAGTGRFAVSDPPYQQTPKKYHYTLSTGEEFKLNFRDFLRSGPETYLLAFDYSQIELRVMAGESGEPALLRAFDREEDVHSATAALMLGIPRDQVTDDQRSIGKTMNFALLYGMGAKSLGERLGVSKEEGQRLYDAYFSSYTAIANWVDRQVRTGKQRGYTISRFGRKFKIWEFLSSDKWIYSKGERLCVNAPIQGGAADYMKVAMVRVRRALREAGLAHKVRLIMNIHDALVFEVDRDVTPQTCIDLLNPAVTFPVPGWPRVVAEWSLGLRWGSMQDIRLDADGHIILEERERDELPDEDEMQVSAPVLAAVPDLPPPSPPPTPEPATEAPSASSVAVMERPPAEYAGQAGATVVVALASMPTEDAFARFGALVAARPGPNAVVLRTSAGDVEWPASTSLGVGDAGTVSMLFSGATVTVDAGTVNHAALVSGLTL